MPYKRVGKSVYVKRQNSWVILKTHPSADKAQKHLVALKINVEHK